MFDSQLSRKLCLAVAAAGLIAVAGCSSEPTNQAQNQAPKPAKAAPKTVAAKPAAAQPATQKTATPKATPVSAKAVKPAGPVITVPKGTAITAVVDQTLAATKNHSGDSFAASLASPVKIDGKTVLPKGAKVTGKVVAVKKNEIKVALASVYVHGKAYDLQTNSRRPSDKVQAKSKSASADKSSDKQKKDNSTLSANSKLTFKLSKPVTVPVKS
jgi:glucose/arabinose dehydrogenase